jgi:hypothetical protein
MLLMFDIFQYLNNIPVLVGQTKDLMHSLGNFLLIMIKKNILQLFAAIITMNQKRNLKLTFLTLFKRKSRNHS